MHSSIGISPARQEPSSAELTLGVRLVESAEKRRATGHVRRAMVVGEILADFLTIIVGVMLGYAVYKFFGLGKHIYYPAKAVVVLASAFAVVMVLMLDRAGAYRRGNSLLRVRETEQVLRVSSEAFLIAFAVSFFSSTLVSRWLLVLCLSLVPLLLFVQKSCLYSLIRVLHSLGYGNEKVLIYGAGSTGRRVFSVLRRSL